MTYRAKCFGHRHRRVSTRFALRQAMLRWLEQDSIAFQRHLDTWWRIFTYTSSGSGGGSGSPTSSSST